MNCWVAPTAKLTGLGEIAIDAMVLAVAITVSFAVPLVPSSEAVMVDEPAATPVATPAGVIFATDGVDEVQLAAVVTFAIEPSL